MAKTKKSRKKDDGQTAGYMEVIRHMGAAQRRKPKPSAEVVKTPMCEECDEELVPFETVEGDELVTGLACDGCGWSSDTSRETV